MKPIKLGLARVANFTLAAGAVGYSDVFYSLVGVQLTLAISSQSAGAVVELELSTDGLSWVPGDVTMNASGVAMSYAKRSYGRLKITAGTSQFSGVIDVCVNSSDTPSAAAGPITASSITDAGTSGIAVLQSETQAQVRAAAGFGGTVTVAELNAAGADARSAMYYCSDCLTVNGPGSLVAWCGRTSTWRTLDDCLLATTVVEDWVNDFIKNSNSSELVGSKAALFCRTSAGAGADQLSGSGGSWRQYPSASAQRYSIMALTNTAAANYARFYSQGIAFAQSPQAKPMVFSGVRGLTLGSIGTGFSVRLGIGSAPNASLSASENSIVYDKGNVLGGLNAGVASEWLGCIRSGSVNLAGSGSLGVGPTVDTEEDLCVIRNGDSVSIYRNGVAVGSGTANAYDIQTMSPFFILANDGTSAVSQRAIMRGFCLGYYLP